MSHGTGEKSQKEFQDGVGCKCKTSESEYLTGDTSVDIHSPGPTIAKTSL